MTESRYLSYDVEPLDAVVSLLSAQGRLSAAALMRQLGCSRATLNQRLQAACQAGIEIQGSAEDGYYLAPEVEPLQPERVAAALGPAQQLALDHLLIRQSTTSTNDLLAEYRDGATRACLAERQTAGRGRGGKAWSSPYGVNLYLSVTRHMSSSPASLSALGLAVGVALAQALSALGAVGLGLKWPNDLWIAGHKVGGILCELRARRQASQAVIGLGLNIQMPPALAADIDQPWTRLVDHMPIRPARSQVAGCCLDAILSALIRYDHHGFAAFHERWRDYDLLAGQAVNLFEGGQVTAAMAHGVGQDGSLQIHAGGQWRSVYAGEASLRPVRP